MKYYYVFVQRVAGNVLRPFEDTSCQMRRVKNQKH
jgi:hypothetical protein